MRTSRKLLVAAYLVWCSATAQEPSVFRAGTRLVEVDVVIRDKNGPVRGLTKDDLTLFDCKASERDANRSLPTPCKETPAPRRVPGG